MITAEEVSKELKKELVTLNEVEATGVDSPKSLYVNVLL